MSVSISSMAIGLSIGEIITTRTNVCTDSTPYAGISDGKLITCFNGKCRSMLKVRDRTSCIPDVTRYIINMLSNLLFNMFRGIKSNLAIHVENGQPVIHHDDGVDTIGDDSAFTAKPREN